MHYFGSKEGIFRAALEFPIDPAEMVPQLLAPGLDGLGGRMVRFFIRVWDSPEGRPLLGVIRSAVASEQAAQLLPGGGIDHGPLPQDERDQRRTAQQHSAAVGDFGSCQQRGMMIAAAVFERPVGCVLISDMAPVERREAAVGVAFEQEQMNAGEEIRRAIEIERSEAVEQVAGVEECEHEPRHGGDAWRASFLISSQPSLTRSSSFIRRALRAFNVRFSRTSLPIISWVSASSLATPSFGLRRRLITAGFYRRSRFRKAAVKSSSRRIVTDRAGGGGARQAAGPPACFTPRPTSSARCAGSSPALAVAAVLEAWSPLWALT